MLPQIASTQRHDHREKIESHIEINVEEESGGVRPLDDPSKDHGHVGDTVDEKGIGNSRVLYPDS